MTDRIQGLWSGSYGDLVLETTGRAWVHEAPFAENSTYEWKFHVWSNTLELKNVEEASKDISFKVRFSNDGETMELTQKGTNNQYIFEQKNTLIYGI